MSLLGAAGVGWRAEVAVPNVRPIGFSVAKLGAVLGIVLPTAGCAPFAQSCNLVNCSDGATIAGRMSLEDADPGEHQFQIELDGQPRSCVLAHIPERIGTAKCDEGMHLGSAPTYDRAEGAEAPPSPSPVTGYGWSLHIDGQPKEVRVRHVVRQINAETGDEVGERVVSDGTARGLVYVKSAPNGEECGPICYSARATLP